MKPKVVTFDCANTLVRVPAGWTLGQFALDCAKIAGLELDPACGDAYLNLYGSRLAAYQRINLSNDRERCAAFQVQLTEDWLAATGHPAGLAPRVVAAAHRLLYEKDSGLFEVFDDVVPTLDALDSLGIRAAVISNWDYSLHGILEARGLHSRFAYVFASLEEAPAAEEKPHPRLFNLMLDKFGVEPGDAAHVGDDQTDDVEGAQGVGMRAYLIDRGQTESRGQVLARLTDLISALGAA